MPENKKEMERSDNLSAKELSSIKEPEAGDSFKESTPAHQHVYAPKREEKTIDELIENAKAKLSLEKAEKSLEDGDRMEINLGEQTLTLERTNGKPVYKLDGKEVEPDELFKRKVMDKNENLATNIQERSLEERKRREKERAEKEKKNEKSLSRDDKRAEHIHRSAVYRSLEEEGNVGGTREGSERYDDLREREDAAVELDR